MKFDYVIVGAGLFAGTFAYHARKAGKSCLVLEKRNHPGGNVYCEDADGIHVHRYGAHIFHTSDPKVWNFVNSLCEFNRYTNSPVANYHGEIYNLPFNMNTFSRLWGIKTPREAKEIIERQRSEAPDEPKNLEEQAIRLVGRDIYEKLIKGYTEKQWGRACTELPAFIIRRLPVRFTYDNNYFNDLYQGIPIGGYNKITEKLFEGCEIRLNTDYNDDREKWRALGEKILYTGPLDKLYDECFGALEYRSLRFETERLEQENYQGVAVMNYTDAETPFTRIIEHKHFEFGQQPFTVITREYPVNAGKGLEPYYPVNDERNTQLYEKYRSLADADEKLLIGGRLARYRYLDMDKVIADAMELWEQERTGSGH